MSTVPARINPLNNNQTSLRPVKQFYGPFEIGGALYSLQSSNTSGNGAVHIHKSLDGGATWVAQDDANSPVVAIDLETLGFAGGASVCLTGTVLNVAYITTVDYATYTIHFKPFDTATDTWGADSVGFSIDNFYAFYIAAMGADKVIVYTNSNVLYHRTWDYGSLGGAVAVNGGTCTSPCTFGIAAEATKTHIIFSDANLGWDATSMYYVRITSGGSVSAPVTLYTDSATPGWPAGHPAHSLIGTITFWNGLVVIPIAYMVGNYHKMYVLIGNDSIAFAAHPVADSRPLISLAYNASAATAGSDGWLFVLWHTYPGDREENDPFVPDDPNALYFAASKDGVTWTAPQLVENYVGGSYWMHNLSAKELSDGDIGIFFDQDGCIYTEAMKFTPVLPPVDSDFADCSITIIESGKIDFVDCSITINPATDYVDCSITIASKVIVDYSDCSITVNPNGHGGGGVRLHQIPTGSVYEMDVHKPGWQNDSGEPELSFMACRNLIAYWPVPDIGYLSQIDIVRNMPVPTIGGAQQIQVGREWLQAILDLAQHLAMFKIGGRDFAETLPLLNNFFRLCGLQQGRLTASTIYNKIVQEFSILYEQEVERAKQQSGRVEAKQPNATEPKFKL